MSAKTAGMAEEVWAAWGAAQLLASSSAAALSIASSILFSARSEA